MTPRLFTLNGAAFRPRVLSKSPSWWSPGAAIRQHGQYDSFLRQARISIEPVTEEQAHIARQAYSIYGKGRHPAGLNFGDCFSYALAKSSGEPLLFKGEEFRKTDIVPALP